MTRRTTTRPTPTPRLPAGPRLNAGARPCALIVAFLAAACSAEPPTAVANLEDLYRSRDEQTGSYSLEVTDRGWWSVKGYEFRGIFVDPEPLTDVEQLDDPIGYGLENLAIVFDAEGDGLDEFEWARAVAAGAEIGRIDPARILRSRGFETAAALLRARHLDHTTFEVKPVDEAALNTSLEPLLSLSIAGRDQRATLIANRAAEFPPAARALAEVRPGSFEVGIKLLRLAARDGRMLARANGDAAVRSAEQELRGSCRLLAAQVAYLAALPDLQNLKGIFDSSSEARISAGRLLLALAPPAATLELGKVWTHTPDPLVRVAWLEALAASQLPAAGVHPTLRAPLLNELASENENAAVRFWAKQAMATLLKLDPEKATEAEVRTGWLALGDWDSGARPP